MSVSNEGQRWFALIAGMLSVYWFNYFVTFVVSVTLLARTVITVTALNSVHSENVWDEGIRGKASQECTVWAELIQVSSGWIIKLTLVAMAEASEDNSKREWNEEKSVSKTHVCCNIYRRLCLRYLWPRGNVVREKRGWILHKHWSTGPGPYIWSRLERTVGWRNKRRSIPYLEAAAALARNGEILDKVAKIPEVKENFQTRWETPSS